MNLKKKIKGYLRTVIYPGILLFIWLQSKMIKSFRQNKKCIYFIATPRHGNLGDHAIVYAQYQLMKEIGMEKNVIEVSRSAYESLRERLQSIIRPEDLIIIDGGGNLGTLWIEEEKKMRDIVQRFPGNPIFIFPQTAYYEESEWGKEELKKSAAIYKAHPRLIIFCRDNVTYRLVQTGFTGVSSYYTPDMVTFLKDVQKSTTRKGVLLCLRSDLESVNPKGMEERIKKYIVGSGYEIRNTSTIVKGRVSKRSRKKKLRMKWEEFVSAELVITDRLHGMIFSAITCTPCIALDNISHKVRDGYEWIKYLPYIEYCDADSGNLQEKIDVCLKRKTAFYYDRKPLEPYYEKIKEEVRNAFDKEPEKANSI